MDMRAVLIALLVLAPVVGAILCTVLRTQAARSAIVLATGVLLMVSAALLVPLTPFKLSFASVFGLDLHRIVQVADFSLLLIILYYGFKHRHLVIIALGLFQVAMVVTLEFYLVSGPTAHERINCDYLSLMMVLIISIVGSIICYQAIPYMREHEHHYHVAHSRQPRFFFVMLLFLGAMNGLVLFNDLTFIYFFFEVTTLCSFLLIGHDRTTIATQNALRALWMNSAGGAAFVLGMIAVYRETGSLELQNILLPGLASTGVYLLALALLCVAAFIKSAQFPFQSWLLGAMVAPTPVSALLHSSTMVKVGIYLVLRLAPGFAGTFLSQTVAVFGAFSFLAGAALAVGQSNGKKVLAYSTISNLGLIFACAGINTAESMIAAMLLLVFHAVIEAEIERLQTTMLEDYTVRKRTVGKGVLAQEKAYELGAVGPTARGSGVAQDARQTNYAAYGELYFEPVVETDGDCYARSKVRFREALASVDLIRRAIGKLPAGEVRTKVKGLKPPKGETVIRVEQPRGELLYYFKGSGEKNLDRLRIRTPTFANVPPLLAMLPGVYLSDVPVVTLSIDPCISCTER